MKKIIFILIIGFLALNLSAKEYQPFAGKTKHKKVKKMSKRQLKRSQKGKTFYYHNKKGKVVKRKWFRNAKN